MKIRQLAPDWLKGLAIVLMVYGHINHVGSFASSQKQLVELIYTFHIPLFLIISGFFFKITVQNVDESTKRLVRRLILPYFIFISLYLIGIILIQKIGIPTSNRPPDSILDFLKTILFYPIGAYWFVHSIILIQLCFIVARMVATRAKLDEPVFISIAIFLLAMSCSYDFLAPRTSLYFLLGMVFSRFGKILPTSLKLGCVLMGIIILIAYKEIFYFSIVQISWCLGILAFLAGIGRSIASSSVASIFVWFGRNSFIVLILHAIFIVSFKPSSNFFLRLDQTGISYSVTVLTATMLASMLVALLLDKARMSKYFFGVNIIYSDLAAPKKTLQYFP